jgi:nitronate monooxygenase
MMKLFNLELPIIQAPMAGGITTPELVAAVSNAGGLGSLGAGYMQPEDIRQAVKAIKQLTKKPFSVNLFIPENSSSFYDVSSTKQCLTSLWKELSDTAPEFSTSSPPSFEKQIEVLLEENIPVFSFTFGIPDSSIIKRFKKQNTFIYAAATTPEEAKLVEQAGVDAIVCQGQEAGGHRGTFSSYDPLYSLHCLLSLIKEEVKLPLIAAGGIMTSASIAAMLALGAVAVQLGTAFLTTHESGAHPTYKKALLAKSSPTELTQVFSGKPARGIVNRFMEKMNHYPIAPYPTQHFLTQPLRSLAAEKGHAEFMSLWAGQGYPLCLDISVQDLMKQLSQNL